jgi:hypothetical protein
MQGRKILKNIAIAMALLALLLPLLYVVDFAVEKTLHRLEVRRQVRQASMQTLVLDAAQIRWVEKGREILVQGEYFDVEEIRYENGKAFITGFFDHRETNMHRAFSAKQNATKNPAGSAPHMARWLLQLWGLPANNVFVSILTAPCHIPAQPGNARLPVQPACPPEQPPQC